MSKVRAQKIKLIIFDVDGVLTDGTIWLFPAASGGKSADFYDESGDPGNGRVILQSSMVEAKGFHAHDGIAISLARTAGIKTGIITKRMSETVALRGRDLRMDHVYQGQDNKLVAFEEMLAKEKLSAEEAAFVGDDIVDLPVMRRCGLAIAVANAREAVKDESHFVTDHRGGDGAARDAIEYILRAQERLEEVVNVYLQSNVLKHKL